MLRLIEIKVPDGIDHFKAMREHGDRKCPFIPGQTCRPGIGLPIMDCRICKGKDIKEETDAEISD